MGECWVVDTPLGTEVEIDDNFSEEGLEELLCERESGSCIDAGVEKVRKPA